MRYLVGFAIVLGALGVLRLVGCGEAEDLPRHCKHLEDGTPCLNSRHPDVKTICLGGLCGAAELCSWDTCLCYRDSCEWNGRCGEGNTPKCDDANRCTSDECDPETEACSYPPEPDDTSCCHEWERGCLTICWPGDVCCTNVCIGGWGACQSGECV